MADGFLGARASLGAFPPSAREQASSGLAELRALGRTASVAVRRDRQDGWITADDSIERAAVAIGRAVYPAIAGAFEREVVPWAQRKIDAWPVRTGKSRSELQLMVFADGQRGAVSSFRGRAAYTTMIKRKGSTTTVWSSEVTAEKAQLAKAVLSAIDVEVP